MIIRCFFVFRKPRVRRGVQEIFNGEDESNSSRLKMCSLLHGRVAGWFLYYDVQICN